MLHDHLQRARQDRLAAGRQRRCRLSEPLPGAEVLREGRRLVNFSGNDYLGLSHDPAVLAALQGAVQRWGAGSGSAHLICGHQPPHERLERALAEWLGYEAALLFPSGYQANLALLAGLLPAGSPVLADRLAHASLLDGARLARARLRRFRHNDPEHAGQCLQRDQAWLLSTEGVFSMDGDRAPLAELARLCRQSGCLLHVDDAHGFGLLGGGAGSVAAAGLQAVDVHVLTVTFGKAMGMSGAAVLADRALVEHLQNHARPWIYSTAAPAAWAEAGLTALERLQQANDLRQRLGENVALFRELARTRGLKLQPVDGPIQILHLQDSEQALACGQALEAAGFLLGVIRPPTSPTPRLRITLSAAHRPEQIRALADALARQAEP